MRRLLIALALAGTVVGCQSKRLPPPPPPAAPTPEPTPEPTPTPEPSPTPRRQAPVKAAGDLVVASWPEPSALPPGGGQAQILIRVSKRGGKPYPGVEVRIETSAGTLFSKGRLLTTDASGMTRDQLTTRKTATIAINAGGTRYSFLVPVLPAEP